MAGTSQPAGSISVEVVADLTKLDAGLDEARSRSKAAGAQIAGDLSKIEAAEKRVGQSAEEAGKAMGRGADAARSATEKLAAGWAKMSQQAQVQERAFQAQERLNAQFRAFSAQGAAQARAIGAVEAAQVSNTRATALHAQAWANLGYQVNDVVTSLSMGMSPMMVLVQQGGQVYQILQGAQGGVSGALGAIKDRLLSISPLVGIFGVLAAGAGTAAVAALSYANAQRDVRLALLGIGQAAGVSAEEIELIARRAADAAKISVSAARDIEAGFLKSGKVYGEVFLQATVAAANFAKATKQDNVQAADFLAQNLGNLGVGGYEALAKQAANFDTTLEHQVRTFLNTGETAEAQRVVLERFGQAYEKVGQQLTGMDRVLNALSRGYDSVKDSLGRATAGADRSAAEMLTITDAAIRMREQLAKSPADLAGDAEYAKLKKQSAELNVTIKQTGEQTRQTAQTVRSELSALDKTAVNAVVPEILNYQKAIEGAKKANVELNALENAKVADPERIQAATTAFNRYQTAVNDYKAAGSVANAEMEKGVRLLRAEAAERGAVTPIQKAQAAQQKSLAESYLTLSNQGERAKKAADAYNRVLAEQRAASDASSRSMDESTRTANEVARATAQTSKSVEYLTAARKIDEQIRAGTYRQDERDAKIQEELRARLAQVNLQAAQRKRTLEDQAGAQEAANARVAAGTAVSAQAQRQVQAEIELRTLARERDAASGEEKAELARRYDELAAAQQRQMSAEDVQKVQSLIEEEKRRIELLEKEASLIGLTTRERQSALAVLQAEQDLKRQGISTTAPESVAYLDKVRLRSDMEAAKGEFERLAQDISSVVSGIFDDMFKAGNKGLAGFLDSFARGFSRIGTRILEQNLIAPLVTGGTGGIGGSNLLDGIGKLFDFGGVEKAVNKGAQGGIFDAFSEWLKPSGSGTGKASGSFASSKLGGGLVSAGVGASIGYQSQSPLMGALGGAATGFAMGGPVGGVVGGIAGLLGGLFGQSEAKKAAKKRIEEQLKAYREAYDQAKPEIERLQKTLRGESLGNVGGQIDQAFQQAVQANKTASQGGDQARADQIMRDFEAYATRLRWNFINAFEGTLSEVSKGFGTSGPFAQANAGIASLGEQLKAFVKDAESLPEADANSARARRAAQQSALAALDPPRALSETQERLAAIRGTAAGLSRVLQDLGMSAGDAAKAIEDRTNRALGALRKEFSADLTVRTNEALGKGYLNEVAELVKERDGLLADARAIGAGTGQVSAYFRAAAQGIVDDAELTGDAFDALVRQFPALRGQVKEFSEALDTAAAKAAAASRALGYQDRAFAATTDTDTQAGALAAFARRAVQERAEEAKAGGQALLALERALAAERAAIIRDFAARAAETEKAAAEERARAAAAAADRARTAEDRLFAARNDTSTQAGALAAYDRKAAQERAEEVAAGGQALLALERAQAAERLEIIEQFNDQAVATQRQALEEAQTFLSGATKNIQAYLDGLQTGQDSALSPGDRLAEAQRQFAGQLALARTGDRDALGGITGYADTLLQAGRDNFASAQGYQDILANVTQQLGTLPRQVSAEQFIVDAINKSNTDLGRAIAANSPLAIAQALDANFTRLDTNLDGRLSSAEFVAGLGPLATKAEQERAKLVFDRIDLNGDGMIDALEAAQAELKAAIQANSPELIQRALSVEFDKLDMDGSGGLTESEFLAGLGPLATQAEQLAAKALFQAIDADGNGVIDKVELMRGQLKTAIETTSPAATAAALRPNFATLDTSVNGLLDANEFLAGLGPLATAQQQRDALAIFRSIDQDGDGVIGKAELIRSELKAAIVANSPSLIQAALAADFAGLDANTDGLLTQAEFVNKIAGQATRAEQLAAYQLFRAIDEDGNGIIDRIELMRGQMKTAIEANNPAAIATALSTNFNKLDTNLNGKLTAAEFTAGLGPLATVQQQRDALTVFRSIDADGNGIIDKAEAVRAQLRAAIEANSPALIQAALAADFATLDANTNGLLTPAEFVAGLGPLATKAEQDAARLLFESMDANSDGLLTKMELMRSQLKLAIETNSPSAIATALNANFNKLDTNLNGKLTAKEFIDGLGPLATAQQQRDALTVFRSIDADGNGVIDKGEAIRAQLKAAIEANSPGLIQKALAADFASLDANTDGVLTIAEFKAGLGPLATKAEQDAAELLFRAIDENGDGIITRTEAMRGDLKTAIEANRPSLISAALKEHFDDLDTNVNGLLTRDELVAGLGPLATAQQQADALTVFRSIDADGNSVLDKLEVIRFQLKTAIEANSPDKIQKALASDFASLDVNTDGALTIAEFKLGLGPLATRAEQDAAELLFQAIDRDGNDILNKTELMRGQLLTALGANSPGAIALALRTNFNMLNTTMDGALTYAEFLRGVGPLSTKDGQKAARVWYQTLDTNADGRLTRSELTQGLIKAAIEANAPGKIQQALAADFTRLDTSTNGLLTPAEFVAGLGPLATQEEQAAARLLFEAMDANGDGLLTATELMRSQLKTAIEANTPTAIAAALNANFTTLDRTMDKAVDYAEFLDGLGPLATREEQAAAKRVFDRIDADGDGQITKLELVRTLLDSRLSTATQIASALNDNFSTLDTTMSGALTLAQFRDAIGPLATRAEQDAAEDLFKRLDTNGSNNLSKLELVRLLMVNAAQTADISALKDVTNTNFATLDASTNGLLDYAEFSAGLGPLATKAEQERAKLVFDSIDADGDRQITKVEAMRADLLEQLKKNAPGAIATALNENFAALTQSTNGRLTEAQLLAGLGPLATQAEQATALAVFRNIDADGNNVVTKLEAVGGSLKAAIAANNAKAFATEIDKSFTDLDTRVDGLLDKNELATAIRGLSTAAEQQTANDYLNAIDADGNGQITKLELIRARAQEVRDNTGGTNTALGTNNTLTAEMEKYLKSINQFQKDTKSLIDLIRGYNSNSTDYLRTSRDTLAGIKSVSDLQKLQLEALNGQFAIRDPINVLGTALTNNMVTALNKIVYNTANTVIAIKSESKLGAYAYASGGWVNGPGTGTSDSIAARLSNGEFVVNAASARVNGSILQAINDNRPLPMPAMPVPVPVAVPSAGMDVRIIAVEIRALREENRRLIEMLARVTKSGSERVAGALEEVGEEVAGHREDDDRRARRAGTGVVGRGERVA